MSEYATFRLIVASVNVSKFSSFPACNWRIKKYIQICFRTFSSDIQVILNKRLGLSTIFLFFLIKTKYKHHISKILRRLLWENIVVYTLLK